MSLYYTKTLIHTFKEMYASYSPMLGVNYPNAPAGFIQTCSVNAHIDFNLRQQQDVQAMHCIL